VSEPNVDHAGGIRLEMHAQSLIKFSIVEVFDRLVRLRPVQAWTLLLLCTDMAALGDVMTGPNLWFGPVYLIVICLAAWSLGWAGGQLAGLLCMTLTFALNGFSLYPYGATELASNFATRFVAMSLIVAIIAGARRTYVREWWLARTDMLTGALNRQAFFELAPSAIDHHSWRLVVYADLDGLKPLNDGKGHQAGDAALKNFASTVRNMIRRDDLFARVGGDEFVVLMAVKDEDAARLVAARLHRGINSAGANAEDQLKCSVGAVVVSPGYCSIDELVRSADQLMYQAKQRGAALEVGVTSSSGDGGRGWRARGAARLPGKTAPAPRMAFADRRGHAPQSA
jgi:diguanylate cyclase (GGDEF)-like protein